MTHAKNSFERGASLQKLRVDAAMSGYVAWREASARVWDAYHGWDCAAREDAEAAFAAYLAALDREEHASQTYDRLVTVMDPLSALRADAQSEIGIPTERVTDERSDD
jgi:hypothetical protein